MNLKKQIFAVENVMGIVNEDVCENIEYCIKDAVSKYRLESIDWLELEFDFENYEIVNYLEFKDELVLHVEINKFGCTRKIGFFVNKRYDVVSILNADRI